MKSLNILTAFIVSVQAHSGGSGKSFFGGKEFMKGGIKLSPIHQPCSGSANDLKKGGPTCMSDFETRRFPTCKCVGLGVDPNDFDIHSKAPYASCEGVAAKIECSCPVPECKDGTDVTCGCHEAGEQLCRKSDGSLEPNMCCDESNRPLKVQKSTCRTCEDGNYPEFKRIPIKFPKAKFGGNTAFDVTKEDMKEFLGESERCDAL